MLFLLVLLSGSPAQISPLSTEDRTFIATHFHNAREFESSQQFGKAASEYKLILDKYPTEVPRVYQNLGLVWYYQRHYEKAIKSFEEGLRLEQGMVGSRLFLGICYLNTEQPDKALAHLEAAHHAQPTLESATSLGQVYIAHGEYTKAIESFEEALSVANQTEQANLIYLIGASYLKAAERIVNGQAKKYPESKSTHLATAKLFESQQGYQIAAIKYLEAAELDPMNASIFFPLARMLAVLGLNDASQLALERYWSLMPHVSRTSIDGALLPKEQVAEIGTKVDFPGILRSLPAVESNSLPPLPMVTADINSHIEAKVGTDRTDQWKVAVQHLFYGRFNEGLKVLTKIETGGDAWLRDYLKAQVYVWLDDYQEAGETAKHSSLQFQSKQSIQMLRAEIFRGLSIEYLARLVEKYPDSCRAHLVKAQNLAAQEEADAEEEFKAAIKGCPLETQTRIELADYYLWNALYEEALQVSLEELSINPYSSAAKKRIGRIYIQLRDAANGMPYLHEAVKALPDDADVHTDLARGYELLEEWEKAIEEYKRGLALDPELNRIHYVLARIYRSRGRPDLAQKEFRLFKANEETARLKHVERVQKLRQRDVDSEEQ